LSCEDAYDIHHLQTHRNRGCHHRRAHGTSEALEAQLPPPQNSRYLPQSAHKDSECRSHRNCRCTDSLNHKYMPTQLSYEDADNKHHLQTHCNRGCHHRIAQGS
jgi:hypothetical protein